MEHTKLFEISLTKGFVAIVDEADFAAVSKYKWNAQVAKNGLVYARRSKYVGHGKYQTIYLHKELMNAEKGMVVDHKDGNGLNNALSNLRVATYQQNAANSRKGRGVARGVVKHKNGYQVSITVNGVRTYLGRTKDLTEAAQMYDAAAKQNFGEFAKTNL